MLYLVSMECRAYGAIGVFETRSTVVEVLISPQTEEHAINTARAYFNAQGFETRFPISVNTYSE